MKGAVLSIGSQKNMFDTLAPKQNAPETEPVSSLNIRMQQSSVVSRDNTTPANKQSLRQSVKSIR